MDYTKDLHVLCETVMEAIHKANERIAQSGGQITRDDVTYIDGLTHALKSIKQSIAMIEDEDGYSGDAYRPVSRGYSRGYRRYSMDRDPRDGHRGDGYSRQGGMADRLRDMMDDAPDEKTRAEIKRLLDRLE